MCWLLRVAVCGVSVLFVWTDYYYFFFFPDSLLSSIALSYFPLVALNWLTCRRKQKVVIVLLSLRLQTGASELAALIVGEKRLIFFLYCIYIMSVLHLPADASTHNTDFHSNDTKLNCSSLIGNLKDYQILPPRDMPFWVLLLRCNASSSHFVFLKWFVVDVAVSHRLNYNNLSSAAFPGSNFNTVEVFFFFCFFFFFFCMLKSAGAGLSCFAFCIFFIFFITPWKMLLAYYPEWGVWAEPAPVLTESI